MFSALLLAVLSGGESEAPEKELLRELYEKYAGFIFSKCVRMLGNKDDAADAVQETFIKAFRSLHTFRYGESHLPWLYQVATSVCLNQLRGKKGRRTVLLDTVSELVSASSVSAHAKVVDALFAQELWAVLERQCDRTTLEIFCAYHLDGIDQGLIAKQLKISRRAVVKRLTRFRQQAARLVASGLSSEPRGPEQGEHDG